jgi:hypothetical protein
MAIMQMCMAIICTQIMILNLIHHILKMVKKRIKLAIINIKIKEFMMLDMVRMMWQMPLEKTRRKGIL